MFSRLLNPFKTNSFFIFGARGVGKSTIIRTLFGSQELFEVDLLNATAFEQASFALPELVARIELAVSQGKWIFIDEVQKSPKLLDVAQGFIDKKSARFIFAGSSARKLKRGGANLLAGRAYTYNLYPLTSVELAQEFKLDQYLAYGGLPRTWLIQDVAERVLFLRSYVSTYLKEEIAEEQIVRKLEPFTRFLQVAAQSSGAIVNYSKVARDVNVSDQTVKTYFQIMEDTLIGFTLPAFDQSIRKAQGKSPKFYMFDTGIVRTLRRTIDQPLTDANYEYGQLFEHFIIHEIRRRAEYAGKDFSYSFLRTADDQEIDLIIDRPGRPRAVIEIKSTNRIKPEHTEVILRLGADFDHRELFILSRDPEPKKFGELVCLPWFEGIQQII